MFDTICDVIVRLIVALIVGFVVLVFYCLGCGIYEHSVAHYVISTDERDYCVEEYREENGYYYATTIDGDECKIPVGIAVVKKNK